MLCLSTNNRSAIQVYKIGGCNALSLNEQQVCYSGIQNEAAMLSLSEQQVCNSVIQNGAAKLCLSANNRSAIQVYKMRLRSSVTQRTTCLQFRYTKYEAFRCSVSQRTTGLQFRYIKMRLQCSVSQRTTGLQSRFRPSEGHGERMSVNASTTSISASLRDLPAKRGGPDLSSFTLGTFAKSLP